MTTTTPKTTEAHVIVTPGDGEVTPPTLGGADDGVKTQVLDRQQYAERLAAGASPVADTLLADTNATVAVVDPIAETSPAPAVVKVPASTADKAEDGETVTVPAPKPTKPTQKASAAPAGRAKK